MSSPDRQRSHDSPRSALRSMSPISHVPNLAGPRSRMSRMVQAPHLVLVAFDEEGAAAALNSSHDHQRRVWALQLESLDQLLRHDVDATLLDRQRPDTAHLQGRLQWLLAERQLLDDPKTPCEGCVDLGIGADVGDVWIGEPAADGGGELADQARPDPVSYTHLTLP